MNRELEGVTGLEVPELLGFHHRRVRKGDVGSQRHEPPAGAGDMDFKTPTGRHHVDRFRVVELESLLSGVSESDDEVEGETQGDGRPRRLDQQLERSHTIIAPGGQDHQHCQRPGCHNNSHSAASVHELNTLAAPL